jgi:pantetheine-phosphate adenylyltransferase
MNIAVYPGTFDPPTNGHLDLIERALAFCDRLIVSVGINSAKAPLFSTEERVAMLSQLTKEYAAVEVLSFRGLLVNFAAEVDATLIIRGLRAVSDFEFELQLAMMNRRLQKNIDTVFLMPDERNSYLNSTIVREVARLGGDVSSFVDPTVAQALKDKYSNKDS